MTKNIVTNYTKKTNNVQAIQWDGTNSKVISEFVNADATIDNRSLLNRQLVIRHSGQSINLRMKDYVVMEDESEFYICRADLFESEYEPL